MTKMMTDTPKRVTRMLRIRRTMAVTTFSVRRIPCSVSVRTRYFSVVFARLDSWVVFTGERVNPCTEGDMTAKS